MSFASIAEAESRIAELETENHKIRVDKETHRKAYIKVKEFMDSKGYDLSGDLEEQHEKIYGKTKSEMDEIRAKLDKTMKMLEKTEKEKEQLSLQQEEAEIKKDISPMVNDVIGGNDVLELWLARKKLKRVDGKTVYVDGDREIDIAKHVENYKKQNPDRIIMRQNNGSESSGTNNSTGGGPGKKMSVSDYDKLSKKEQDKFVYEGGEVS